MKEGTESNKIMAWNARHCCNYRWLSSGVKEINMQQHSNTFYAYKDENLHITVVYYILVYANINIILFTLRSNASTRKSHITC